MLWYSKHRFQKNISFPAWQYDIWKFTTKPFNRTRVLVSDWNVITEYEPPTDRICIFPAVGTEGKFKIWFLLQMQK